MFKLFLIINFFLIISAILTEGKDLPKWSEIYSTKCVLIIPYAELEEPFSVWFDGTNKQSRIDYYGDMVKTYQLGKDNGENGRSVKIVPMTTEEVLNRKTCLEVNGTAEEQIGPQTVLPDLTGFQYIADEIIGEFNTEKWTLTNKIGDKVNDYTIWIKYKGEEEEKIAIPVKYEMRGFNSLLGSHYDHYYIVYDQFDTSPLDAKIFQVPDELKCQGFPGPGDKHIYTFNPIAEFIRPERTGHVDFEFQKFIGKHRAGTHYVTAKEQTLRKGIFTQNLRFIHSHNRKNLGYSLSVNHLADKTDNELKVLRGRQYTEGYNGGLPFPHNNKESLNSFSSNVPTQFDWRLLGAVTPVKDQSVCGSCWSFGTVGTVEGALFLRNGGHLMRLSQQALVDCSWGFGNNGCDGGEDFRAYQWIQKHGGIPTEEDYGPYLGQDGYCHVENVPKFAKIQAWFNVSANDEMALRLAIFKHGPVSVAIDASRKTFSFYSNGVYYDENCKNGLDQLDHAVLAVGYGTLNGNNYWLVKNSWSNYWGNDGYVLIASKANNCGVMTIPTYVTLE